MKIDEYKKLEKKIKSHSFNQSYGNIDKILLILSYFGNITSIFLAYFFMSKIIKGAVGDGNTFIVFIVSLIILMGIELLKRDIFDKFSIQYLKDKGFTKLVIPLLISSFFLISASFYSSLSGAKEFSYKNQEIENAQKEEFTLFKDSISEIYEDKFAPINLEIDNYKKLITGKDEEQSVINKSLQDRGYLTRGEKDRNNQLTNEKKSISEQIEKNENKLKELDQEKKESLNYFQSDLSVETESEKEENSKNSFIFIILSTIIELVILGGVFFNQYYKFRSYKEFRQKIEKDPNYQKWLLYDQMLSILITNETKINQKLPSNKAMIESCKVNDIIVLPKDITNFLKVLNNLGIIKSSGSAKYIVKLKEVAQETLRNNFNIE